MILARYLLQRLCLYTLLINSSLAVLYNVIEFFEKIVKLSDVSAGSIVFFIFLNIFPSFFELLALSTWLSMCLLLWEIQDRGEWESCSLIGIQKRTLFLIFALGGLFLSGCSFLGKEYCTVSLRKEAERVKLQELKGKPLTKFNHQWITHNPTLITYFELLDKEAEEGTNLIFFFFSPQGSWEKIIHAPSFKIDEAHQLVILAKGTQTTFSPHEEHALENYSLSAPFLFSHLRLHSGTLSIFERLHNFLMTQAFAENFSGNEELGTLLEQFLRHTLPFLYVMTVLSLFMLFYAFPFIRWIVLALPYLFFLITTNLCTYLVYYKKPAWIVALPYIAGISFVICCFYYLSFPPRRVVISPYTKR